MGRKGGGRSGFLKASRMAPSAASDDEPETAAPAQPEVKAAKDAPAKTEPEPAVSKKASAFLVGAGSDDGSSDEDSGGRTKDGETRGKMMQRHKREAKAVKDQIKKLGKKGKDEGARLLAEMEARHAEELAQLVADPPADAVGEEDGLAEALGQASLAPKEGKKPTKAQRRREQKAREDAEREARIAAENAELGETERMAEERELQLLLKPLGLAVKDIPPDGHCLYRSLGKPQEQS